MKTPSYILFILIFLWVALVPHASVAEKEKSPAARPETPKVTAFQALTGPQQWLNVPRALTKEDLNGRILLLDFWTYCCINCMQILPDLRYLEEKFGADLTVIGVHSAKFANEKDTENIRQAVLRYNIAHPVVNDADFSLWKAFGVRAWPTFMLVDPKGEVVSNYSGEGHRDELERDIAELQKRFKTKLVNTPLPLAPEKDKEPEAVLDFPGKLEAIPDYQGAPALAIADSGNNRILIADLKGTILKVFGSGRPELKDGARDEAGFHGPQGVLYGEGVLYVADTLNHALRRIDLASDEVTTLAGTGEKGFMRMVTKAVAKDFALASPWDIAFFPDTQHIVIAMAGTHQLWSYDTGTKKLNAIAGGGGEYIDDGVFPFNTLAQPSGLSVLGDTLYFVDAETSSLRDLTKKHGMVTTRIGKGLFDFGYVEGSKDKARLQHPLGVYADDSGVYIADAYNHALRRYDTGSKTLSNFAGTGKRGMNNGNKDTAQFSEPGDITRIGDTFYIADTNNHRIRTLDAKSGEVGELAVMPPQMEVSPALSDFLPNMNVLPKVTAKAGKPFAVSLTLKPGWHINKDAPSYLALFDAGGKALQSFTRKELSAGNLTLSIPEAEVPLRLQGTFYYCEDKAGSLCLIKSIDVALEPAAASTVSALPLELK